MLINDADTQARWWMRVKDEWIAAQARARLRQPARTQDPALAQLSRTAPMTDLATLETELLAAIAAANDEAALEAVRVALGRNGSVSARLKRWAR